LKKPDNRREQILHIKRENKRIKRLRFNKYFKGPFSTFDKDQKFKETIDQRTISNHRSKLQDFFLEKAFITGNEKISFEVTIPPDFSFCNNYSGAIKTIQNFIAAINTKTGNEITIDFSNCNTVDQAALFFLQILRMEFYEEYFNLDRNLKVLSCKLTFKIIQSKSETVNKLLLVTGLVSQAELKLDGLMPVDTIGYYRGNKAQKHYAENKKGIIGTRIAKYLNQCLLKHDHCFNPTGLNYLDGLISEVLNNGEDHSPFNTYYVTANMLGEFAPQNNRFVVGEVNLSFLNFGFSFFDGFEQTKTDNFEMYGYMEALYNQVNVSLLGYPFTKENLFTLYALQGGVSRLKNIDESRGNGTMNFINSFFSFGDFEDTSKKYHPDLSIYTGKTQLICDNKFKPFEKDGVSFISLNRFRDLSKLPEKSNLKNLNYYFPGTLITVKIYLNKEHLTKKLNKNNDNKSN